MLEELQEEFLISGDIAATEIMVRQTASAWYIVTYSDPEAKFLSFPWIVAKYLINIKLERTLARTTPFSPAIMNMDEKISECESKQLLPPLIETRLWREYHFACDTVIVRRALQTLMLWAEDEDIIDSPGRQGLLSNDTFVMLFLHAAELAKYVTKGNIQGIKASAAYSSGHLCMEFLKFCSTFRFYNKYEIRDILPFTLRYYNKIAKCAIVSYHRFALSGTFQNLYFDTRVEKEMIQMKSINIESKIFDKSPIDQELLRKAEEALMRYSRVEEVSLREIRQTKKVCVSARGTEQALKELKSILRKKHVVLRQLFKTGIMPETK